MTMAPFDHPISECPDCGVPILRLDEQASELISDDGSTLLNLPMIRGSNMRLAFAFMERVNENGPKDKTETIIRDLASNLLIAMELLSRFTTYGYHGTGDDAGDDACLEKNYKAANDYLRAITMDDRTPFSEVQIDISNALCDIGWDEHVYSSGGQET